MVPIKVALLWHQHQPDYRINERIVLPWVRLHSTKDYLEMVRHLEKYPDMHATINLVPSLIRQIDAYRDGFEDELLRLSRKDVATLSDEEKSYLLRNCFSANHERMIRRSPRYYELLRKNQQAETLSDEELRDITIHHALAWTGEFIRSEEPYESIIKKDRNFSEDEKTLLFASLRTIVADILPAHKKIFDSGQVEISSTPFYHPILPLICDTNSAIESREDIELPNRRFNYVHDAFEQVRRSKMLHQERFDSPLLGMWPAEGSISNEVLRIMAEEDIKWTATDESVLLNSLCHDSARNDDRSFESLEKYFPRKFLHGEKNITVFFRDHVLSDRIGFDYATWDSDDAANDFIRSCKQIRGAIFDRFGEEAVKSACITVILDGENCWENYHENGKYFLHRFYDLLTSTDEVRTVTFSGAMEEIGVEHIRPISHIVAGSWINANFKIWIGQQEKNRAWDLLSQAAETLHSYSAEDLESKKFYESAHVSLLQAEGSDWFWWYGDDHKSDQKHLFDELFRAHLVEMYIHLRSPVPLELFEPIASNQIAEAGFSSMHRATD